MSLIRKNITLLIALAAAFPITGCGGLLGGLRHDFNDEEFKEPPVVGGAWAERGYLAAEEFEQRARGRAPAAEGFAQNARNQAQGWVNSAQAEANRAEFYRGTNLDQDELPAATYSGMSNLLPSAKRLYKNGQRATKADFLDESPNEGSLWAADGQSNYFFSKNKIRTVGDIISVKMDQDLIRDVGLEMRRGLTQAEKDTELQIAQNRLNAQALGLSDKIGSSAAGADRSPASVNPAAAQAAADGSTPSVRDATYADVDVSKSLELKADDVMMGEIIERYPNGNYKIRATKKVAYKNGSPRLVSLVGIARGTDISEEDVIPSGKLYEYRLEAQR